MATTRREVLRGLLAAGVGGGVAGLLPASRSTASVREFSTSLRIPALDTGRLQDNVRIFDLATQAGMTEFLPGRSTPTIGVNGSFLGPVLRFRAGEQVSINVKNQLPFDTTLHWHGLHVPAKADGGPHQVVTQGTTWSPRFEIKQKAGLFWYHSHLMEHTGEQVNLGLAGPIIIEDEESTALGLPFEYGVDDIPLVIQDRRFRADGRFDYLSAMPDMMMGFKGNVILVNGTVSPYFDVRRKRTRLRLLNGSNSRIYNIGLSDGRPVTQIASDGSLLEKPVQRKTVRLGPGERAEILIDLDANSTTTLTSNPDTIAGGMMMGMAGNSETFPILQLRSGAASGGISPLPARLIQVPNWDPAKAERRRSFRLDMGMMGMMGGRGGMMGRGGMGGGMTINGKAMDIERIDERVHLGAIEIWTVQNPTPLAHPFHIHAIQFRILDRNGAPPLPHELGLKDTVLVDPGESVRIITRFDDYADAERPYMYHCHILEHEDAGMMGQFIVTA